MNLSPVQSSVRQVPGARSRINQSQGARARTEGPEVRTQGGGRERERRYPFETRSTGGDIWTKTQNLRSARKGEVKTERRRDGKTCTRDARRGETRCGATRRGEARDETRRDETRLGGGRNEEARGEARGGGAQRDQARRGADTRVEHTGRREGESSRRGTEVGIDRRRKDCRDERGGSPAAQAPLRRRHIDSSGKSLQNGRRRSIPSLLFVRGRLPSI